MNSIGRVGMMDLGRMGRPVARHLLARKFVVTVFDIDSNAVAEIGSGRGTRRPLAARAAKP